GAEESERILPDPRGRIDLLKRVKQLLSSPRDAVTLLEVAGREVPGGSVQLSPSVLPRIERALATEGRLPRIEGKMAANSAPRPFPRELPKALAGRRPEAA